MFKETYNKYLSLIPVFRFLINGAFFYLLWLLFYFLLRDAPFIDPIYEWGTEKLTHILLIGSKLSLLLLGYDVVTGDKLIYIEEATRAVLLDRGCLGRNLMGLFAGFIVAYPGKIINKLWYIPLGLMFINILNVMRISGLTIIWYCCPDYGDINHDYVFKYSVYALTFVLWYIWISKYSRHKEQKT